MKTQCMISSLFLVLLGLVGNIMGALANTGDIHTTPTVTPPCSYTANGNGFVTVHCAPTGQRELPALLVPSHQDPALSAAVSGIPSYGSPYIPYMPEPAHMSPVKTATEVATAVVTSVITVPVTYTRPWSHSIQNYSVSSTTEWEASVLPVQNSTFLAYSITATGVSGDPFLPTATISTPASLSVYWPNTTTTTDTTTTVTTTIDESLAEPTGATMTIATTTAIDNSTAMWTISFLNATSLVDTTSTGTGGNGIEPAQITTIGQAPAGPTHKAGGSKAFASSAVMLGLAILAGAILV